MRHGGSAPWPAAPILNVIGVPMTTAFGGVPLQLRARLRRESMLRPVALLCREPGGGSTAAAERVVTQSALVPMARAGAGWRLEAWSDGRPRRAMTFPAGAWDGDPLTEDPDWLHAVQTCRQPRERPRHPRRERGRPVDRLARRRSWALAHPAHPRTGRAFPSCSRSTTSRSSHAIPTLPQTHAVPQAHADSHESPVSDRQRFEHAFHHALGTGIVRAAAFTIYPSQFMRHRIEALPHLPAHVVAPGIEPPARTSRSARRHDQIALLGGGQEHKGGPRLARIAAALAARGMHVTSYGGYGHEHLLQMRGVSGVRVRGYYRAGSLPELLARQGASVALILSNVPESFSLVLSEAWAAGVPVIAPASGAFIERLRARAAPAAAVLDTRSVPPQRPAAFRRSFRRRILLAVDRARGMPWDTLPSRRPPRSRRASSRALSLRRILRDAEILDAVDRARRMPGRMVAAGTLPDGRSTGCPRRTPRAAAERHLTLYRDAGFTPGPRVA